MTCKTNQIYFNHYLLDKSCTLLSPLHTISTDEVQHENVLISLTCQAQTAEPLGLVLNLEFLAGWSHQSSSLKQTFQHLESQTGRNVRVCEGSCSAEISWVK